MVLLSLIALAVVVGRLLGGSFRHLGNLRLRGLPILLGAFGIQLALFSPVGAAVAGPAGPYFVPLVYAASNLLVLVALWLNRRLWGVRLALVGLLLNMLVMIANGGYMPLSDAGQALSGNPARARAFNRDDPYNNSRRLTQRTRLPWLADVILVRPLGEIYSLGDLFIFAAIAGVVLHGMRSHGPQP